MRILHTADWRLGRAFHGADLLAEQAALLEQLASLARERRVDALFVAGGLLADSAPPEAGELLDHALGRFALDEKIAVVALAGARGPGLGRGLLARMGVHLIDDQASPGAAVELRDESGTVRVHALTDAGGWERFAEGIEAARGAASEARRVLLARVPTGEDGGRVDPKAWSDFACCLLGGRRRAREVVPGRAWQAGWLIAESFEDAAERRTVGLVEIDAKGRVTREELALPAERGLAVHAGTLAELLEQAAGEQRRRACVSDEGLAPGLERLAGLGAGLLEIERPAPAGAGASLEELFAAYCERVEGRPLSELDRRLLADAMAGRSA